MTYSNKCLRYSSPLSHQPLVTNELIITTVSLNDPSDISSPFLADTDIKVKARRRQHLITYKEFQEAKRTEFGNKWGADRKRLDKNHLEMIFDIKKMDPQNE
ncbi:hypothetical protein Smp_153380 [Schistosoma mansoni]|uniref:hypothetical protein n=1 Tax=Schistosoma mansoni TaxID=6183 RepID=UPI0001A6396D|nr:hypothetical protein Smp_153380 [Schistosoma mansoni]|eukprot:XP_018652639.1 hypothetical protein Smp_153380 [Schistosoma mansoni]